MTTQDTAAKELAEYKKQKANILGPITTMECLSEFHSIVIDSVFLSIDPLNGDIYKHKDGYQDKPALFIITGQGLQRLAVCAGVVWNPVETKATVQSQQYVAYNAVGCIRKSDGVPTCFQAEYDIDLEVIEDELRDQYAEKAKKWASQNWFKELGISGQQAYIDAGVKKDLIFKKKHKTKMAATGAKNRVIRALLGIKKTYTMAELKKPFVMPRVILQPDYNDPEVKKMMLTAAIQSMTGVFGPALSQSQAPEEMPVDIPLGDYDVQSDTEDETQKEEPLKTTAKEEKPPKDKPKKKTPPENQKPEQKEDPAAVLQVLVEAFVQLPKADQEAELTGFAAEKKYDIKKLPDGGIEGMNGKNRIRFFEHLQSM